MQDIILSQLSELERTHNVRILFAIESGSRAWGFPSPDSDYDVRFVYAHQPEWYVSLTEQSDVIELPVNEVLDIGGWDIRKALRLMAKSNAVIFEWMQSPIVYKEQEGFLSAFAAIAPSSFSPIAAMHHYLSMAKGKFAECMEGEQVKLKRYMYCLRALLSALWIMNRKSIPPMEIQHLLAEMTDQQLRDKVTELIGLKATKPESYLHPHEHALEEFLTNGIQRCEQAAPGLPAQRADHHVLNAFLRTSIGML
jgi:predicted nucleotidyltransferase